MSRNWIELFFDTGIIGDRCHGSDKIKNKFMLCLWQPNSAKPNPKLNW
ncbi:hypothetical protein [Nostoc sp.]